MDNSKKRWKPVPTIGADELPIPLEYAKEKESRLLAWTELGESARSDMDDNDSAEFSMYPQSKAATMLKTKLYNNNYGDRIATQGIRTKPLAGLRKDQHITHNKNINNHNNYTNNDNNLNEKYNFETGHHQLTQIQRMTRDEHYAKIKPIRFRTNPTTATTKEIDGHPPKLRHSGGTTTSVDDIINGRHHRQYQNHNCDLDSSSELEMTPTNNNKFNSRDSTLTTTPGPPSEIRRADHVNAIRPGAYRVRGENQTASQAEREAMHDSMLDEDGTNRDLSQSITFTPHPVGNEHDDSDKATIASKLLHNYRIITIACIVLLAASIVIVVVVIVVVNPNNNDNNSDNDDNMAMEMSTTTPNNCPFDSIIDINLKSAPPQLLARYDQLIDLFSSGLIPNFTIPSSSSSSMEDCDARHAALIWLAHDDIMATKTDSVLLARYVLAVFYMVTAGTSWSSAINWLSNYTVCEWERVHCKNISQDGGIEDVSGLLLHENKLDGTIPKELDILTSLVSIDFSVNNLQGTFPSSLLKLGNLEYFKILQTGLEGEFPFDDLVQNTKLRELLLEFTLMEGTLSTELGLLSNLEKITLHGRALKMEVPTEIGLLSNLVSIKFQNVNSVRGEIPTEIGSLQKLQTLNLVDTNIKGTLPTEIGNLEQLEIFGISGSLGLSGTFISEIGRLRALRYILFSDTRLTGSIPTEIGNCELLSSLNVEGTSLVGPIPSELGRCTALEYFDAEDTNGLSGTIPKELGNLTNLKWLRLSENTLSGSLPLEITSITSLELLNLQENQLSGTIPFEVNSLTNLGCLNLSSNPLLFGTIQCNFGKTYTSDPDVGNGKNLDFLIIEADCSALSCGSCCQCEDVNSCSKLFAKFPPLGNENF